MIIRRTYQLTQDDCKRIKLYRESKRMPMSALAKFAGVSASYICRLENGDRHGVSVTKYRAIAAALNMPVADMGETDYTIENILNEVLPAPRSATWKGRELSLQEQNDVTECISTLLGSYTKAKKLERIISIIYPHDKRYPKRVKGECA